MGTKLLLNSYLTFCLVTCSLAALSQDNCKEIKATIEVFQSGQKAEKASLAIDFHGHPISDLFVTLIGPKGYFEKDIQETEIKDLQKGTYTLVITSKRKEDNFCQKHFGFTVK
jgi:uncharacterized membrane protein